MDLSGACNFLILLLPVMVLLLVRFLIGREFCAAAREKGYPQTRYLLWILFTGIPGMLLVAALPDRGIRSGQVPTEGPAAPFYSATTSRKTMPVCPPEAKAFSRPPAASSGRNTLEAQDFDSLPRL